MIAYSDPMPRVGPGGRLASPGHVGAVYQDFGRGLAYRGRARPRTEHVTPDGRVFSARAASKIRGGERGFGYAVEELVRRGAPAPTGDDLRGWYDGLAALGFLRPRRHPGNHVYTFALTQRARVAGHPLGVPRAQVRGTDVRGFPPGAARRGGLIPARRPPGHAR